ncbi:MAG TPA: hypothetical protein VER55_08105, partial [Ardenticatenaceae bacterium]|nr:hypothetical protein [Ardenticatenaceae bacterium]
TGAGIFQPFALRVGGNVVKDSQGKITAIRTVFNATLPDVAWNMGPLLFKLKNVTIGGGSAENFYGIKAGEVKVQWASSFGGQTGPGLSGFKLGVTKSKKLVFQLAGGSFQSPAIQNGVFKGTNLNTQVSVVGDTAVLTVTGSLQVVLPGSNTGANPVLRAVIRGGKNVRSTCGSGAPANCIKRFEAGLAAFNVRVAGFGIGIAEPRLRDDGGFQAISATLSLPPGLGNLKATITGFVIEGDGDVSITGGEFELPPLQIANTNFVGLKGGFSKSPAGGYRFIAGGTMALPGLDPSAAAGGGTTRIAVEVVFETEPPGGRDGGKFRELGVKVSFQARPGFPIGNSGMELTKLSGEFNLKQGQVTIGVGVGTESTLRLVNFPVVSVEGNATLKVNPFRLDLSAEVRLLIFKIATATIQVGDGAGFNGGKGVHVEGNVSALIYHGEFDVRLGRVNNKTRFSGSASLFYGIKKKQFGTGKPPFDIGVGATARIGTFDVVGQSANSTGVLASLSLPGPWDPSIFADFSKSQSSGSSIKFPVDAEDYILIDQVAVAAMVAQGVEGFSQRTLSADEVSALGLTATPESVLQVEVPIVVTNTATTLFGINFVGPVAADPVISLRMPGGRTLTEGNVNAPAEVFIRDVPITPSLGTDLLFIVDSAPEGNYQLVIDNAPPTYEIYSYGSNNPPTVSEATVTCGGPEVSGVTITCDGAATGTEARVSWSANDSDNPEATVTVSYAPAVEATADLVDTTVLAEGLPLGGREHTWNLSDVPTGRYRLVVEVNDGRNAPVTSISETVIEVVDQRAPAIPEDVTAAPLPGQLLVRWSPNAERDLAGYEIGFGVVEDSSEFLYTRTLGTKELVFTETNKIDARLWGLQDDQTVYYGLRAYDRSGNYSDWSSPLVQGKPWALSPRAWTPAPDDRVAIVSEVEVAFDTPLVPASIDQDSLVVRRGGPDGARVAGTVTQLLDINGEHVLGIHFEADAPLEPGSYLVIVDGGEDGVTAVDGRRMPEDYNRFWRFTVVPPPSGLYLPLLQR